MKWLSVEDVWGIGRQNARNCMLRSEKKHDFTQMPESWVLKHMTVVGLRLQKDLKGVQSIDMEEVEKKKSI